MKMRKRRYKISKKERKKIDIHLNEVQYSLKNSLVNTNIHNEILLFFAYIYAPKYKPFNNF